MIRIIANKDQGPSLFGLRVCIQNRDVCERCLRRCEKRLSVMSKPVKFMKVSYCLKSVNQTFYEKWINYYKQNHICHLSLIKIFLTMTILWIRCRWIKMRNTTTNRIDWMIKAIDLHNFFKIILMNWIESDGGIRGICPGAG